MIIPPVPSILLVMVSSPSSWRNFYGLALLFPLELVALLLLFECRGCPADYSTTDLGDFKLTFLLENVLRAPSGIVDSRMNGPVVTQDRSQSRAI